MGCAMVSAAIVAFALPHVASKRIQSTFVKCLILMHVVVPKAAAHLLGDMHYRVLPRRATMAAAVSSIDRRLTSIIGQLWRVQIWRA